MTNSYRLFNFFAAASIIRKNATRARRTGDSDGPVSADI